MLMVRGRLVGRESVLEVAVAVVVLVVELVAELVVGMREMLFVVVVELGPVATAVGVDVVDLEVCAGPLGESEGLWGASGEVCL